MGGALADHLHAEGARLTVADVRPAATAAVAERTGAAVVPPEAAPTRCACDVYSPCALGGALVGHHDPASCGAAAVVGSANNQLATPQDAQRIDRSGVLYAPDYVVNAGGVINIAEEKGGYDRARAEERIRGIHDTVLRVLDLADAEGITTAAAADLLAERRIDAAGWPDVSRREPQRPERPSRWPGPTCGRDRRRNRWAADTGGPVPTADDLSVLHLHDRHTGLGLGADDLVGMYRTILTGPRARPEDLEPQPDGQGRLRRVGPGPRGRAGRRRRGRCGRATTSCCPTTATPA